MTRSLAAAVAAVLFVRAPVRAEEKESSNRLEEDSGVSVQTVCTNCNNADLTVGGLGNDYVPILCDGLVIPPGLGQIYLLSVMPQTLVDKVTVRRGAGDASLDGGAIGGGIEIERFRPAEKIQLNLSGDAGSYGWNGQRLDLRGRHGWFGGSLAVTRAESDAINANGDVAGGYENWDLPEFDRTTWEARLDLQPSRNHSLRLGAAGYEESQENGRAAYDGPTSDAVGAPVYNLENVELEREQYDLLYEGRLPDGSRIEAGLFRADRTTDILETQVRTLPEFIPTYVIDEVQDTVHGAWSRAFGLHWRARAGASWSSRDSSVVDVVYNALAGLPPDRWFDEAFEETVEETGLWADAEWSPNATLDLTLGLRLAEYTVTDEEARPAWVDIPLPEGDRILPRAALSWKPAPAWTLRATAGAGYRPPPPTYAEVCCGRRYRNNRGVAMESSRAYGLEATWQPGPKVRLNASGSLTDFDDLVVKLATLTFEYRPTYQNASAPEARLTNLSFEGRWEAARWVTLRGSYSWLSAENRSENDRVVALIDFFGTPVSRDYPMARIPYRAERNAALGADFRIGSGTTISVSAQYTGPMFLQTFDRENPVIEPGYFSETQDHLVETEPFTLVNLRVEQRFPKGVSLYAGVDNLGDEFQSDLGDPRFDYNWGALRGRYVYGGIGWNFGK
jgi:outer membrane receptor protein involved in Fe transport